MREIHKHNNTFSMDPRQLIRGPTQMHDVNRNNTTYQMNQMNQNHYQMQTPSTRPPHSVRPTHSVRPPPPSRQPQMNSQVPMQYYPQNA
jgi:hypothetical protein